MTTKDTGGPAFPIDRLTAHGIAIHEVDPANEKEYIKRVAELSHGVTVRDYFAGEALSGLVASCTNGQEVTPRLAAKWCYEMADAMLEARKA